MHYPLTAERRRAVLDGLSKITGASVTVVEEKPAGHVWAPVTRLTFDRELRDLGVDGGAARSVIVKTRRVDGEGHGGPAHLRREAAGLLTAAVSGVVPRMLYVDGERGVVVQSDAGEGPTLEMILLGDDADRAAKVMCQLGVAMGRLHESTLQRPALHDESLARFGRADVSTGAFDFTRGTRRWAEMIKICDSLGFPDARGATGDLDRLVEQADDPGIWGALAHHDLNPTNVLVTDDGVRLIDFEGASYGHIGLDISVLHYPFVNYSAHWAVIPDWCAAAADRAYRDTFSGQRPGSLDGYDAMLATGAAICLIGRVMRLSLVASENQSTHDSWRRRAQLVQQIGVFGRLADRAGTLTNLADWFRELADAMTQRWADATSPPPRLFPAFEVS